jgi:acetyltransferase-like isoleucine patch superfamily enzyme
MGALASYPVRAWRAVAERWREAAQVRHCVAGQGVRVLPSGRIANPQGRREAISIGRNSWIAGELLVFAHAGCIRVGEFCYVGDHTRVWSAAEVSIGHRVFVAHGVNIHDNDAHSTSAQVRHRHFRELATSGMASFVEDIARAPVAIEDDAWVGFNSTILKGTRVGRGAIVGACSLVTRDVAPFAIVAGNPAVVIGEARP